MLILILTLAMSLVICLAAIRWSRHLPSRLRRPALSLLIALLCPLFLFGPNLPSFVPVSLCFVAASIMSDSIPDDFITGLLLQTLIVWILVYLLWTVFAFLCGPDADNPARIRRMRIIARWCLLAAWIFIVCTGISWFYLRQTEYYPWDFTSNLSLLALPFLGAMACGMMAMLIFLVATKNETFSFLDIFWTFWAAVPVLAQTVILCLLGLSNAVDWFFRPSE